MGGWRVVDPSEFDPPDSGGGRVVPRSPDATDLGSITPSAPTMAGYRVVDPSEFDAPPDTVDKMNAWAGDVLRDIKPFASGVARGAAGLASMAADYSPTNLSTTIANRMTGEPTAGDRINDYTMEQVGPADPKHPYASAMGEMLPSMAIPGGGLIGRGLSTLGSGAGLGFARDNNMGAAGELMFSMAGGLAPSLAQGAARLTAPTTQKAGLALRRKAMGARGSDYAKTAENIGPWNFVDGVAETPMKQTLNETILSDKLGKSANPEKLLTTLVASQKKLGEEIGDIVAKHDASGKRVIPAFTNALDYVANGGVQADEAKKYLAKLANLERGIATEGKGTLTYLQRQKDVYSNLFEQGNDPLNGFHRAIYYDLQKAIEKAAPAVKPINQQLQKFRQIRPILERNLGAAENETPMTGVVSQLRTSGGVLTTPPLIGAALGGTTGGPIGAAAGLALGAATTKPGQNLIGRGLIGSARRGRSGLGSGILRNSAGPISNPTSGVRAQFDELLPRRQRTDNRDESPRSNERSNTLQSSQRRSEGLSSPNSPPNTVQNQAKLGLIKSSGNIFNRGKAMAIPSRITGDVKTALLKAVEVVESGGRADAVSPKGAIGTHQVTPIAMREVMRSRGENDKKFTNAELSKIAAQKGKSAEYGTAYFDLMLERFGDPLLALAAYNAGETTVRDLLKKSPQKTFAAIAHKLPEETRNYVPRVVKNFDRIFAV